jgi:cyclohexanone monooxygenase
MTHTQTAAAPRDNADAVVIGAGFAGLYMLHRLRGMGLTARGFEAASGVGGTWFWNAYPGARCDVDSLEYSYSFDEALQQEWTWSERFAGQPEIMRYLNHVANRLDLRGMIALSTRVLSAIWDDGAARWTVTTDKGDVVSARFVITATGCLSMARAPDLPGLADFRGQTLHTGHWPHEGVDLRGKRVGVIGTGSSGIQAIPMIARDAAHVTVFQRTANFAIPARNTPTDPAREREWKAQYAAKRAAARETTAGILYDYNDTKALSVDANARAAAYEDRWQTGGVNFMRTFCDLGLNRDANVTAADFVRAKIRETVQDPATAEALSPNDHPIGAKRICIDTDYFSTFNRPNVTLVNIRKAPITGCDADGVITEGGRHPLDILVFATGFDAVTGALAAIDIRGVGGASLNDKWQDGPISQLGLISAGFPNLFTVTGPGSPSILTNVVVSIEQHVAWIADAIAHMQAIGARTMDADPGAELAWMVKVGEAAGRTLFVEANSWYLGANIPGKPRVFLPYAGGFAAYRRICEQVAADGYPGFVLRPDADADADADAAQAIPAQG